MTRESIGRPGADARRPVGLVGRRGALSRPLLHGGRLLGTISVGRLVAERPFTALEEVEWGGGVGSTIDLERSLAR